MHRISSGLLVLTLTTVLSAGEIEAIQGKSYPLTDRRGPWMIMVATFHSNTLEGEHVGKTPEEAANELVYELRTKGLPAYSYRYDPSQQTVNVTDRLGRPERRKTLSNMTSYCVLAGNYTDLNDKIAQDSIEWVKKYNPKCLQEGVIYTPTPGRPGPLSGAFLTPNPLMTAEDVEQYRQDPLLVRLNHGERYSLYENKGEYTLVVARFYGKSMSAAIDVPWVKDFLKDNDLDNAGHAARELVAVLNGNYDKEGKFNKIDAYIWHDRHESVVTVGSFSSTDDPAIKKYIAMFGPKVKLVNGVQSLQPEHYGISGFGKEGDGTRLWLFEPNMQTMRVPKLR